MTGSGGSDRPLAGTTVVVTRPVDQSGDLVDRLRTQGAAVMVLPVIAIEPVPLGVDRPDPAAYDWVAFTSANGVRHFLGDESGPPAFGAARVAAVGPATAAALAAADLAADLTAPVHTAAGLCRSLLAAEADPATVLVPQAEGARPTLVEGLRSAGWNVEPVAVYRTATTSPTGEAIAAVADADVVTFASPSAVRAFRRLVGPEEMPSIVATIGPVTSAAASDAGIDVDVEADVHSAVGLVDALVGWLRTRPRPD